MIISDAGPTRPTQSRVALAMGMRVIVQESKIYTVLGVLRTTCGAPSLPSVLHVYELLFCLVTFNETTPTFVVYKRCASTIHTWPTNARL